MTTADGRASADVRRHSRARDAEGREGPVAEDQTGIEDDVQSVAEPQRTHGDRSITSASEYRVNHDEQHDRRDSTEHHLRIADAAEHLWRRTHHAE